MTYINIFFILLLFQLLFPTYQEVGEIFAFESQFPNSITLNNGNILISGKDGLYIYELSNLNIVRNVLNYDETHKITSKEMCVKTTFSQLPDEEGGNILYLLQDKIFVFSPDAIYKKDFDLSQEVNGIYFSLNFYKKENEYIYYILAYTEVGTNIFNLVYYKMNIEKNENLLLKHKTHQSKSSSGNLQPDFPINIECGVMKSETLGKVLVCFHENRGIKEIGNSLFLPDNNFTEASPDNNIYIPLGEYISVISAAISISLKKALVCYILSQGNKVFCFFYNIDNYSHTAPKQYTDICRTGLQEFRVYYFQKTHNFLFGCGSSSMKFKFIIFNDENNILIDEEISDINNCFGFDSVSFAFFENISKYLMIMDGNCNTGRKIRLFSIDNYIASQIISTNDFNSQSTLTETIANKIHTPIITTIPTTFITTIPTTIITTIPTTIITTIPTTNIATIKTNPTTIITTNDVVPTTIIATNDIIPTTIIIDIPKLINTTISNPITTIPYIINNTINPTTFITIITSIPDSITVNIPTSIAKSIPTLIITTIPYTITESIPTGITPIHTSIATIPTKISTIIPNLLTTYPSMINITITSIINKSIPFAISSSFPSIITTISTIVTSSNSLDIPSSVPYLNLNTTNIYKVPSNIIISFPSTMDYNKYSTLPYYNSFSSDKPSQLLYIIDFICPENKPLLKKEKKECVQFCSSHEIIENKCLININIENNFEIINKIIRQIVFNTSINENTDLIIKGNNIIFQISTTDITKKNLHENISSIDFGNCETKLKESLQIDYIIIQKADIKKNNITFVKYELYNPNKKEEKIDLSICKNDSIQIYSPIDIDNDYINDYYELLKEGYNILYSNDSFYNDICTPFTSKSNTDIILYDRKIEYYNPNLTHCENGCNFKNIEIEEKKIHCECSVNTEENYKITYQKYNLRDSFYKTNKYSNFKVIICYKLVFSLKGQTNNFGSYLLISILIFYIITSIIYISNSKKLVSNLIIKILDSMNLKNYNSSLFYKPNPIKKKYKQNININNNFLINISKNVSNINKIKDECLYESTVKLSFNKKKKKLKKKKKRSFYFKLKKKIKNKNNNNSYINNNNYKYNDEELNLMTYEDAIIYDKRSYIEYYISLLNKKQLILFTFISKTDYNLRVVKIALFLISFSLCFTVNAFFFGDKTIHIIHENKGIFNFLLQLLPIVYSSAISIVCNFIIKALAISENNLISFKKNYKNFNYYEELIYIYKCLKKKINIFFLVGFIFLIFFWYFITAFCAVYNNTQIIYFKDCALSFFLSLVYPFLINLIPGIFRIPSLKNNKRKFLYSLANIIGIV